MSSDCYNSFRCPVTTSSCRRGPGPIASTVHDPASTCVLRRARSLDSRQALQPRPPLLRAAHRPASCISSVGMPSSLARACSARLGRRARVTPPPPTHTHTNTTHTRTPHATLRARSQLRHVSRAQSHNRLALLLPRAQQVRGPRARRAVGSERSVAALRRDLSAATRAASPRVRAGGAPATPGHFEVHSHDDNELVLIHVARRSGDRVRQVNPARAGRGS